MVNIPVRAKVIFKNQNQYLNYFPSAMLMYFIHFSLNHTIKQVMPQPDIIAKPKVHSAVVPPVVSDLCNKNHPKDKNLSNDVPETEVIHRDLRFQESATTATPAKTIVANNPEPDTNQIHPNQTPPEIWNGNITMSGVATVNIAAIAFSSDFPHIVVREFPLKLHIVGRIDPCVVWEYLNKLKLKGRNEIVIVRFAPQSNDDEGAYNTLFKFLLSKARLGVIAPTSPMIKDFYILPLASHKSLPPELMSSITECECGFESNLLLGIIVKHIVEVIFKYQNKSILKFF